MQSHIRKLATAIPAVVLVGAVTVMNIDDARSAAEAGRSRPCTPAWNVVEDPLLAGVDNMRVDQHVESVAPLAPGRARFGVDFPGAPPPSILTWNGSAMAEDDIVRIPFAGPHQLGALTAFSSDSDGWFVTHPVNPLSTGILQAQRWSGGRWSMVPMPPSDDPENPERSGMRAHDMAAIAPDDAWIVGSIGAITPDGALIQHWDGTSWRNVDNPAFYHRNARLTSVEVIAPDDIWAVGLRQGADGTFTPLVEHWDGTAWTLVDVPPIPQASANIGVTARASDDVWVVGSQADASGTSVLMVLHFDGESWSVEDLPDIGSVAGGDIHQDPDGNVWVVPAQTGGEKYQHSFLRHTADGWDVVPAPGRNLYGVTYWWHQIDGTTADDVWAVGQAAVIGVGSSGVVAHFSCGNTQAKGE